MKYFPYVLKHLKRNWIRTASTLTGLALCIFLICVLQTVLDAIRRTTEDADPSRIITRHAVSVNFRLPLSYKPRIQAIPGVRTVAMSTWFGGIYRDIKDSFPNFAVESEDYFKMYPEIRIPPNQYREYLQDMQGLLIGSDVAVKHGFTIGNQIQMENILTSPQYRVRGPLKFNVRAIYTADPAQASRVNLGMAFFHHKYLYESMKGSGGSFPGAGTFNVQVSNPAQAGAVMRAIDANFENSDVQTRTETEGAYLASFIKLTGNLTSLLNTIGMAVAFTILLVTANTMSMAVRERRTEIAVLKTLGFSGGLVMALVGHRAGAGRGGLHGAAAVHGSRPRQPRRAVGVTSGDRDHFQHRRGPWRRRWIRTGLRCLPRADHRHVEAGVMAVPLSYNVRSLYIRRKLTMLAVGGIALVIAALIVLIAMANGFRVALSATGSPINAIVTQRGSASELTSAITRDGAQVLSDDPRVMKDANGRALSSPERVVVVNMRRKDGADINLTVRGVSQTAFTVRTGIAVTDGRSFQPGLYEVIVGRKIFERIEGMEIGQSFTLQRRDWTIAGVFEAGGSAFESEIWGDVDVIGPAFNRGGYHSVTLRMRDPSAISALNSDLEHNPRMQVQAVQERKYYEDQSGVVSGQLLGLAVFVAIVMGIGAVFGAMNTMYALVAARTHEIGTLRALGFSKVSILTAFVVESTFLAIVGGALGCLIALPANGMTSAAGGMSFSEIGFAFRISGTSLVVAMVLAVLMGVAGGVLPAFRAARMPITSALRDA
jgi:ABC-type lipoprotein release transport system permease subunit